MTKDRDDIVARYLAGVELLQDALAGLARDKFDLAQDDGSWSICQIVHHIADGDDIWKSFIIRAAGNQSGGFDLEWYWTQPQDEWVECWSYATRDIDLALNLFRANRLRTVELLRCDPDCWERKVAIRWPDGEQQMISIGWVVEMQAGHVEGHAEEIGLIRQSHGV